jgi:chemotaxis protein methyltransferase CheR
MNALLKNEIALSKSDFDFVRMRIYELAGISLTEAKLDLVQSRLRQRVVGLKLKDLSDYLSYLHSIPSEHEEWEFFVNQLTTNKTDWFREIDHFDFLIKQFIPKWLKLGKKKLSVWCAASSTGEEPYTLSLVLAEALKGSGVIYEIIASDIDTKVLAQAKNGVYRKDRLEQVPNRYQHAFSLGTGEISDWMKVKESIKRPVQFQPLNLTSIPYPWSGEFDLVMCRNVLIYFNAETIQKVVQGIYQTAKKDSVLIIAHSESLQNIESSWKYFKPSIYIRGNLL